MKKVASFTLAALMACVLTLPAFATERPEEVKTPTPLLTGLVEKAPAVYPVGIEEYMQGDSPRLSKVYELSLSDDPALIPTGDFVREGYIYALLDMTRADQSATDTKAHSEVVTLNSKTKDADQILQQLATTKTVTTTDGYSGVLTLNLASIKTEVSGYGSSSRSVTSKRTYPNLSDADTSLIPKTTEDNGRTLTLADIHWQEVEGYYTATANYTGTSTSKYAKGYTVTASYTGEVSKTTSDTVRYTAIFGGTTIQPEFIPFDWGSVKWLAFPIGAGVVILAVVLIRHFKFKRKGYYSV